MPIPVDKQAALAARVRDFAHDGLEVEILEPPYVNERGFLVVKARATRRGKRVDADEEYWFLNAPLQQPIRKEVGGRDIMVVDAAESLKRILARSIVRDERRRKR